MNCQECRDALSAHLDGEAYEDFDAHLDGCTDCQVWFERAAAVTRLTRIGLAVPMVGVPESVLDAAPKPAGRHLITALRIALGSIGAAQLLLAVAQIAGAAMAGMSTIGSAQGATPDHLLHETAAWNIGVGAAFLLIAGRFARPASVVGILTAFVGALDAAQRERPDRRRGHLEPARQSHPAGRRVRAGRRTVPATVPARRAARGT